MVKILNTLYQDDREEPDPFEAVAHMARNSRLVPVISDFICREYLFGGADRLARAWADDIDYPANSAPSLYDVADLASGFGNDPEFARSDYLDFIKAYLIHLFEIKQTEATKLVEEAKTRLPDSSFSEVARILGYPYEDKSAETVLGSIAALSCPVYLTTSYHTFLEEVLQGQGFVPRTDFFRWHEGLTAIPSAIDEKDYQPSVQEPLVYHLLGLDRYPASIVLTEQDHLDFLLAASVGMASVEGIFILVRQALAELGLVFLGYGVDDLAYIMLQWSLLQDRGQHRLSGNWFIHPRPDTESEGKYIASYLHSFNCGVIWSDPVSALEKIGKAVSG
jgi:hypothetical protein